MSRKDNRPTDTEPAEFPDGTEIQAGANYAYDPFRIVDPDPEMKYFFAADDKDAIRPDGARRLMAEKGYRKSDKAHGGGADCVLLEIPLSVWEQRQAAKAKRDASALTDSMRPSVGREVLPGHRHGVR